MIGTQQINLFNPDFVPRRDIASAKYAACGVAIALVVAIAGTSVARWSVSRLAAEEHVLAAEVSMLRTQSDVLSAQSGVRKVDPALEKELADVQVLIRSRHHVVRWLQSDGLGNTRGVSEYFRALARQTLSGLWLTRFQVNGDGKNLRIEGRSLRGDLVPQYLGMLSAEQSLKGRAFSTVALEQSSQPGEKAGLTSFLTFQLEAEDATAQPAGGKQ